MYQVRQRCGRQLAQEAPADADLVSTVPESATPAALEYARTVSVLTQAFRFMVGPGHCPMFSKYGPLLFKAVGPVDPSFLVVKKSHFNENIHLIASLRTPQNR